MEKYTVPQSLIGPTTKQAFFLVLFVLACTMVLGFFVPIILLTYGILNWPASEVQTFLSVLLTILGALGIGSTIPRLIDPTLPVQWIASLEVDPHSAGQSVYGQRVFVRYSKRQYGLMAVASLVVYGIGLGLLLV